MTTPARLVAIAEVHLQSPPGLEDRLRWFYADFLQLQSLPPEPTTPNVLQFKSERLRLRITLTETPRLESVDSRALFEVPSLDDARDLLRQNGVEFTEYRGLSFTDRSLSVLDPAGNRLTLRRRWPGHVF